MVTKVKCQVASSTFSMLARRAGLSTKSHSLVPHITQSTIKGSSQRSLTFSRQPLSAEFNQVQQSWSVGFAAADRAATCSTVPDAQPGTHRGHINLFLTALGTPYSASVFLWFLTVPIWPPAFTAVTRVQIPSGTPTLSMIYS